MGVDGANVLPSYLGVLTPPPADTPTRDLYVCRKRSVDYSFVIPSLCAQEERTLLPFLPFLAVLGTSTRSWTDLFYVLVGLRPPKGLHDE